MRLCGEWGHIFPLSSSLLPFSWKSLTLKLELYLILTPLYKSISFTFKTTISEVSQPCSILPIVASSHRSTPKDHLE